MKNVLRISVAAVLSSITQEKKDSPEILVHFSSDEMHWTILYCVSSTSLIEIIGQNA